MKKRPKKRAFSWKHYKPDGATIFYAILFGLLICRGLLTEYQIWLLSKQGHLTKAIVRSWGSSRGRYYIYEFRVNSKLYEGKSWYSYGSKPDDSTDVLFLPEDPSVTREYKEISKNYDVHIKP